VLVHVAADAAVSGSDRCKSYQSYTRLKHQPPAASYRPRTLGTTNNNHQASLLTPPSAAAAAAAARSGTTSPPTATVRLWTL